MTKRRPISTFLLVAIAVTSYSPSLLGQEDSSESREFSITRSLFVPDSHDGVPLSYFTDLLLTGRGTILVPQKRAGRVIAVTDDGVSYEIWARRGGGPGELAKPDRIGLLGDSVWVADNALRRFTIYLDREVIRTVTLPPNLPIWPEAILSDGTMLVRVREAETDGPAKQAIYAKLTDARLDTVLILDRRHYSFARKTSSGTATLREPFSDSQLFNISANGSILAVVDRRVRSDKTPPAVALTLLSATGDTVLTRMLEYEPIPIRDEEVETWVELYASLMSRRLAQSGTSKIRKEIRESLFRPASHPHVSRVVAGHDGVILLQLERVGPQVRSLLLDQKGHVLGNFTTPADFIPIEVDRNHVWGQLVDELDVPHLVRYDFEGPVEKRN